MNIDIVKAIKVRWNARSLTSVITGGIHNGRCAPKTEMPYAILSSVSDTPINKTYSSRYNRALIQIDVYGTTADLVGYYAGLIREALSNSQDALSNPLLADPTTGKILTFEPDGNPVEMNESDDVWRSMQTFSTSYSESRNLIPAV